MKSKIIIGLLSSILILLLSNLYFGTFIKDKIEPLFLDKEFVWNPEPSLIALVQKENDKEVEKVYKEERLPNYMKLYPDMYVDSIKPIINVEPKKIAYISFDDGPSEVTSKILDILDEHKITATFFIIAGDVKNEESECLKRMVEAGHVIGIHTSSHEYKDIYSSVEAYIEDFYKVYQYIYETTGLRSNIFRFPWGSSNSYNRRIKEELKEEMKRRGFTYYDWNVSAEDSIGNPSPYRIKQNILKDLNRYMDPIILLHDSRINKNTAKALPNILESIKEKGYDFDTLDNREPYQFNY